MLVGTPIEHLLLECSLARSGSEATRKVQQGAVRVNGEKFTAVRTPVDRRDSFRVLDVGVDGLKRAEPIGNTIKIDEMYSQGLLIIRRQTCPAART
jgi:ribosomal protein S4